MGLVAPRLVGSSRTKTQTRVPCIGRQIVNHCTTREALLIHLFNTFYNGMLSGTLHRAGSRACQPPLRLLWNDPTTISPSTLTLVCINRSWRGEKRISRVVSLMWDAAFVLRGNPVVPMRKRGVLPFPISIQVKRRP